MDFDAVLTAAERLQLLCLRCAVHSQSATLDAPLSREDWNSLRTLASQQRLIPLTAEALYNGNAFADLPGEKTLLCNAARRLTVKQAARTADFLHLYACLDRMGLRPAVLKGIVCRSLYPEPEQRPSSDEDLLIAPAEFSAYHTALISCGLRLLKPEAPTEEADEVTYVDPKRDLTLELHLRPFPSGPDAAAFIDCNRFFSDALSRTVELPVCGQSVRTLHPTDHLLFLLCHAYKHILYSGLGVRQICDLCLFASRFSSEIDWDRLLDAFDRLGILKLSAAFFRIGQTHLQIPAPPAFADAEVDELPLLKDCLGGGLYGADDPDRPRSSHLTLDAVAATRQGRRRRGILKALFPSFKTMSDRYPYLKKLPWLLPWAWGQRAWTYSRTRDVSAGQSLEIGRQRIELLRRYGILP